MKIKFAGTHSADEVVESLTAILRLFEEHYGIGDFHEIKINLTLVNKEGEEVELIDASTSEVFDQLEVHKQQEAAAEEYPLLMSDDRGTGSIH